MILLIDNYDSFTHNLARYARRLGAQVRIVRNDDPNIESNAEASQAILISPGPCGPEQAGKSVDIIRRFSGRLPILGICLGHQAICHAWGGKIIRARRPIHGRALPVELRSSPLFHGMQSGTRLARYHSLVADQSSLPACLQAIAYSLPEDESHAEADNGEHFGREIMAVQHIQHLTFGVQFHPESILSADGYLLLANFLALAGWQRPDSLPQSDLTDLSVLSPGHSPLRAADSANHWMTGQLPGWSRDTDNGSKSPAIQPTKAYCAEAGDSKLQHIPTRPGT